MQPTIGRIVHYLDGPVDDDGEYTRYPAIVCEVRDGDELALAAFIDGKPIKVGAHASDGDSAGWTWPPRAPSSAPSSPAPAPATGMPDTAIAELVDAYLETRLSVDTLKRQVRAEVVEQLVGELEALGERVRQLEIGSPAAADVAAGDDATD